MPASFFFRGADSPTTDDIVTARGRIALPFLLFCSVQLKETACRIINLTAQWFAQSVAADSANSALLQVASRTNLLTQADASLGYLQGHRKRWAGFETDIT